MTSDFGARPSEGWFWPALPTLVRSFFVLLAVGASLWAFGYLCVHHDLIATFASANKLALPMRRWLIGGMAGSGLAVCLVALTYLLLHRSVAAVGTVARAAHLLGPLMLTFPLPLLLSPTAFSGRELHFSLIALGYGLLLERLLRPSFRAAQGLRCTQRWSLRVPERLPFALAVAFAVFFGCYFSYYTVLNHLRLQTTSWDLAIFDNMMWNLIRGEWFKAAPDLGRTGSHIQYHATFDAYLFAPFYALRQRADTLLVIQGVLVGLAAVPIFLLVKARTQSAGLGLLLAVAYGFHAPLHGPIFYDFHFLTLAPFFISWVLYFYETERKWPLLIAWIAAVLLREDQSATLSAAMFFFLLSGKRPRVALLLGVVSALYFVLMKFAIMPLHRTGHDKATFSWMFTGLIAEGTRDFGGVLATLISNPIFVLESLIDEEKLLYLLKTFGPVLLLPLRSARTWILFVPAAIFTLLSSGYKPLYQTYFQYTSNWTPYVFFGTAVALAKLRAMPDAVVRVRAAATALLVSVTLFTINQGALVGRHNFRGGFRQVQFHRSEADKAKYEELMSLVRQIPKEASVAATEAEAPHVSNREDCFTMRFGHDDADYLLLSIAEARGGSTKAHAQTALGAGEYGLVEKTKHFMLWQKGLETPKDAQALRQLGVRKTRPKATP